MLTKIGIFIFLLASCARAPVKTPEEAMRLAKEVPAYTDVLPMDSLRIALQKNIQALESTSVAGDPMVFGIKKITKADYILALREAVKHLASAEEFQKFVREKFDVFENYGRKEWGDVFSTGYYEAHVKGSRKKTAEFSQPIYAAPKDLVTIDLGAFAEKNPDFAKYLNSDAGPKVKNPSWRGRLVRDNSGTKILPYYDRKEIDQEGKLIDKSLILAWLDPLDAFFMQVQGSGVVDFSDGKKMRLGYAAQNGYPYVPVGKFLTDAIPLEKMSMQRIRAHLSIQRPEKRQELLNLNPSYVFFRSVDTDSLGTLGAELTAGRSIAVDQNLFPLGALCFMSIEFPNFADPKATEESGWVASPRFVLAQDTGGAIRGGGRADLFTGADATAEQAAGVMKRWGLLYYLAPKDSFLVELKNAP